MKINSGFENHDIFYQTSLQGSYLSLNIDYKILSVIRFTLTLWKLCSENLKVILFYLKVYTFWPVLYIHI